MIAGHPLGSAMVELLIEADVVLGEMLLDMLELSDEAGADVIVTVQVDEFETDELV